MSVIPFPPRVQRRACQCCGERLAPWQPVHHKTCKKCYGFSSFRRAVDAMLRATEPRP